MSARVQDTGICDKCNSRPSQNDAGLFVCKCGTRWVSPKGTRGSEEEIANLAKCGFTWVPENFYYMGLYGHILFLYADGSWSSDQAHPDMTLEAYLETYVKGLRELESALNPYSNKD